ncbi:hypothetical protein ACLIA0_13060 [Bacillaceae bacterium W0354]
MRKIFGIILIAISIFFGITGALFYNESILVSLFLIVVICLPLFIIGQITRTSLESFKENKKFWITIFLYLFILIPAIFNFLFSYEELKRKVFHADDYVVFAFSSSDTIGAIYFVSFAILITLLGYRLLSDIKRKKMLTISISCLTVFIVIYSYVMFTDYQGIHKEDGLITSNWKGEKSVISYDEINYIDVHPYLRVVYDHARFGGGSTDFAWKVYFVYNNEQNQEEYQFILHNEDDLINLIKIKELASQFNKKFVVREMSKQAYSWFKDALESGNFDKDEYYELFNVSK